MLAGMTKKRPGYHDCLLQIPDAVWALICADADARRESMSKTINEILRRHYRVPLGEIPPPRRPGRKPRVTP